MSQERKLTDMLRIEAEKNKRKKEEKSKKDKGNKKDEKKEKFEIPEYVKIAWDDLAPSISSVFRASKWKSKYASFKIFNNWFSEQLKGKKNVQ